jgi:tripartite-type tricarboxylate transporter receptor subunit TctC
MRKMKTLFLVVGLVIVSFFSLSQAADYPTKDLSGIIQWGAGGATDNVARALTPLVEQHLGKQIILQNKPGATGAVAVQWVYNQPSDGYTLLYGAENPLLYRVLDISQLEYKDFYPVIIFARNVGVVVCNNDQPWKSIKDLFEDAKKNPGQIKMGSTGPGGLPHVTGSMFRAMNGVTFNEIPFGGEGPSMVAMQGGHVQFTTVGLAAGREHLRAGRIRALAMVADASVPGLESVPLITSTYPEYKKYLPWGPFYGVWVKRDASEEVKKKLVDAFQKGTKEPKAQDFIKDFGSIYMGIYGDEADKFLKHWQSVTTWLLQDAGAAKVSPDKFGIPKP